MIGTKENTMAISTLKQIQKLIDSLETVAELNTVGQILKARHNTVQCLAGMQFRRGQSVVIQTKVRGAVSGKIERINAKTIDVATPLGKYRVSPTLVKAA
jgi:hypothetical protein